MSSLTTALNLALAGINHSQANIAVSSSNITNASTEGYTRKELVTDLRGTDFATFPVGGQVIATRDPFLEAALINDISIASKDQAIANSLNRYQQSLGSTGGGFTIPKALDQLRADFLSLAALPNDANRKYNIAETAELLAGQIRGLQADVQALRQESDNQISVAVDRANVLLNEIHEYNNQVTSLQGRNTGNIGDIEDQRLQAIYELSELMDVKYFFSSDNRVTIFTSTGQNLVSSGGAVRQLDFTATSGINKDVTYPGTLSGVELNGVDISNLITGGEISAHLQLRDTTLAEESQKLDELATQLIDTVNAATNDGSSLPPVNSITGLETGFLAGDPVAATGLVRISTIDANGVVVSTSDINLALSGGTIGGVVGQINALPGVSASLNADGALVVTAAGAGNGVAINNLTSDVGPDNRSLAHFFGLNSLFSGTDSRDIDLAARFKSNPEIIPSGTLESGVLAAGDIGVPIGDGNVATAIADSISDQTTAFSAAGNFAAQTTSISEYAGEFLSNAATRAANADITAEATNTSLSLMKTTLQNETGVNVDEETAFLLEMENAYQASAQVISTVRNLFDALIAAIR